MKGCKDCGGTRLVKRTAKHFKGGKPTHITEYTIDCPRCEGADIWRLTTAFVKDGVSL